MGRLDMAVREYKMVSDLMPGDFRPYYNIGAIYQHKGGGRNSHRGVQEALKETHLTSGLIIIWDSFTRTRGI